MSGAGICGYKVVSTSTAEIVVFPVETIAAFTRSTKQKSLWSRLSSQDTPTHIPFISDKSKTYSSAVNVILTMVCCVGYQCSVYCFLIDAHYNCINECSVNCVRSKHYDPCAIVMP